MAKKRQAAKKGPAGKRQRLNTGTDVRYAKRDPRGRWTDMEQLSNDSPFR